MIHDVSISVVEQSEILGAARELCRKFGAGGCSTHMRGGSAHMRGGSAYMRGGSAYMRGGSAYMRGGSAYMRGGSTHMRGGSAYMPAPQHSHPPGSMTGQY